MNRLDDFIRKRENALTPLPVFKGEQIDKLTIASRLGSLETTPRSTILSPIGFQEDPAGLVRATILGLRVIEISLQLKEGGTIDKDVVPLEILNRLRDVLGPSDFENFDLTPEDIIALAAGDVNKVVIALRKLTKLLPITPIDTDEPKIIYEHMTEIISSA